MNEARTYASLSSGLLARKGTAKPAMRPQGYSGFEDLGWNDMGYAPAPHNPVELPEHVPSSIAALTPLPKSDEPSVIAQQRAIAETFEPGDFGPLEQEAAAVEAFAEPEPELEPEPEAERETEVPIEAPKPARVKAQVVTMPQRAPRVVVAAGRKSAFTLRLDADRHLRLRLACAVTGRSAQQIVCAALDSLLDTIPEVEALAQRVPAAKRN
jgi:hypothetical protein